MLRVNHLRTQCASQVLLEGVDRAGDRQNFTKDQPELLLKSVRCLPVNHLRTEDASEVLLMGVDRAGERQNSVEGPARDHSEAGGLASCQSPAHLMCLRGTSGGGLPRR